MLRDVQGSDTGRDIHTRYTQHTEPTLATKKKVGGQVCTVDGDNLVRTVLSFVLRERRILIIRGQAWVYVLKDECGVFVYNKFIRVMLYHWHIIIYKREAKSIRDGM